MGWDWFEEDGHESIRGVLYVAAKFIETSSNFSPVNVTWSKEKKERNQKKKPYKQTNKQTKKPLKDHFKEHRRPVDKQTNISKPIAVSEHFLSNDHNANGMQLIPLELMKSNRVSVRKAREAYLIDRGQTLEPLGLNRRDET